MNKNYLSFDYGKPTVQKVNIPMPNGTTKLLSLTSKKLSSFGSAFLLFMLVFMGGDLVAQVDADPNGAYGPVCEGSAVVSLIGSPVPAVGETATWNVNGTSTNGATAQFDPTNAGSYNLTYTISGSSDLSRNGSETVIITVNALPTVTSGGTVGDYGSVCENDTEVTLTGLPNPSGSAMGVWSGDGVTDASFSDRNAVFDPSGHSGTKTFTYTFTDNNGCMASEDATIVVNKAEIMNPALNTTTCENSGLTIALTATPTTAGGVWSGLGVTDNTGGSGTFDPSGLSGNITVTYKFTDPTSGCVDEVSMIIEVTTPPTITTGAYGPLCDMDDPITLNLARPLPGNGETGTWSGADHTGALTTPAYLTNINPTIGSAMFDPATATATPGTYTLYYVFEDTDGCKNSESVLITVNAAATATATADKSGTTINSGDEVCDDGVLIDLAGTPIPGVGETGTWSGPGVTDASTADGAATFNAQGLSGTQTLTYTFNDGCESIATIDIEVVPLPTVSTGGPYAAVCDGATTPLILRGTPVNGVNGVWTTTAPATSFTDNNDGTADFRPSDANVNVGSYTFTYTFTNTANCSNSETTTVTVNDKPTVNAQAAAITVCTGEYVSDVFFAGSNGATFDWTGGNTNIGMFSATGTNSINGFNAQNNGPSPITVSIEVTPNLNGCLGDAETYQIIVNPLPTADDPTNNGANQINFCAGMATTPIPLTSAGGATTFTWTNDNTAIGLAGSGNGTYGGATAEIPSFNATSSGTAFITLIPSDGNCAGNPIFFSINVTQAASVNNPGNQVKCEGEYTDVINFSGTANSYEWEYMNYQAILSDNIIAAQNGTGFMPAYLTSYTAGAGNPAIFEVTPIINGCPGPVETFTITINEKPTIGTLTDPGPFCSLNDPVLTLNNGSTGSPTPAAGEFGTWSGNGLSNVDPTSGAGTADFDPTGLGGTVPLTYTFIDANGCSNSEVLNVLVHNDYPTTAAYVPVCEDALDVVLTGNPTPNASQTGIWTGLGVTDNPSGADNIATFDPTGQSGPISLTYTFRDLTKTNAAGDVCESVVMTTIEVGIPSLDAGVYSPLCQNDASIILTGSPVPAVTESATWSGPTGSITDNGDGTASFDPSIAGGGTHTLTYTFTNAIGCIEMATTSIMVNAVPSNITGSAYSAICEGDGIQSPFLNGYDDSNMFTGTWSGPGVQVTDNINTGTADFNPAGLSGLQTITYTYINTIGCTVSETTTVQVNAEPIAATGTYNPVCQTSGLITLTGFPVPGVGETGTWSGIGVSDASVDDETGMFNPSGQSGAILLTYLFVDKNGCQDAETTTITVTNLPTASTGTYGPICENATAITLSGSPVPGVGESGEWSGDGITDADTDDNIADFNPSGLVANSPITVTYKFTDATGCEAISTTTIIVNEAPIVDAGTFSDVCEDAPNITITGSPIPTSGSGEMGTWSGTNLSAIDPLTGTAQFDPTGLSGSVTLTYTFLDANSCEVAATTTITVKEPDAGTYPAVCQNDDPITLTGSPIPVIAVGERGEWRGPGVDDLNGEDGVAQFNPANAGVTSGLVTVFYKFIDADGCEDEVSTTIAINAIPMPTVQNYNPVCEDGADVILVGGPVPSGVATGVWSGDGVTDSDNTDETAIFDPSNLSGNVTLTYTYTDINGCTSDPASGSAMATIFVHDLPAPTPGTYAPVCENGGTFGSLLQGTPNPTDISGTIASSSWTGLGVINSDPNTGIADFNPSGLSGDITLTYSYTNFDGCSESATTVITVNDIPTPSTGTYGPVCENAGLVTLAGLPVPSVGEFGQWQGIGVIDNANTDASAVFDPSNLGNGVYILTYTFTDANNCTESATTNVTVNVPLTITIAPIAGPICEESPAITVNATPEPDQSSESGTWTGMGITDGDTGNGSASFDPSGLSGSITLTYTFIDDSGCTSSEDIIVNITDTEIDPGTYSSACESGGLVNLSGSLISGTAGGTYTWSGPVGTVVDNGNGTGTFDPSAAGGGTHTLTLTYVDIDGCMDSKTTDIIVESPVVDAGTYGPICEEANPINLTGSPVPGIGESGEWTGTNVTDDGAHSDASAVFDPTGLAGATPIVLTYTFTDASGCISSNTTSILVNEAPAAEAGLDQDICEEAIPITLTGLPEPDLANERGTWSGQGITDADDTDNVADFNPSGLTGTITLTYTFLDVTGCMSSDDLVVTVTDTEIDPGTYSSVCESGGLVNLSGSLISGTAGGTYTWSGPVGTVVDNGNGTGIFDPSAAGGGTHTLTLTYVDIDGCMDSKTTDIIVESPVVDAGTYGPICEEASPINLTGSPVPGIGESGEWTGTNVTDDGAHSDASAVFDPTGLAGATPIVLTYTFTDASGCISSNTTSILVNEAPAAEAGLDQDICEEAGPITLTGLPEPDVATERGIWSGQGITDVNNLDNVADFDPSGLSGTITLTYTFIDVTGCISSDELVVTVTDIEVDPEIYGPTCESSLTPIVLGGLPTGGIWTGDNVTLNGGTGNYEFSPTGLSGATVLTYSLTDGNGCTDSKTTTIMVESPVVDAGTYGSICEEASPINLTGSPVPGIGESGEWTGTSVTDDGAHSDASAVFDPTGLAGATPIVLTYTFTDASGCISSNTTSILVNEAPIAEAGLDQNVCEETAPITLTGLPEPDDATERGTWSGQGITDANDTDNVADFDPSGLTGTFTLTYTFLDVTGCTSTDEVVFTVTDIEIETGTYGPFCESGGVENLTATFASGASISGGTSTWTGLGVTNGTNGGAMFNPSTAGAGTHTLTYKYIDANGCEDEETTDVIVESPVVVAGTYGPICTDGAVITLTGSPTPALNETGTWSIAASGVVSGTPTLTESSTADEIATLLPNNAVGTFTLTYTFVDVDGCSNSHSSDIIINAQPIAAIIGSYPDMCASAAPITLTGSPVPNPNPTTSEGTWSGMGVTDADTEDEVAEFDPAGLSGTITLTYTYTDEAGCTDSETMDIVITNLMVDAGTYDPVCESGSVVPLVGTPSGGTWSGDGVTGTNFDPSGLTGTNILTYSYTNSGCTEEVTTSIVVEQPTVDAGTYSPICTNGAVITLTGSPTPALNETGTWSVTASGAVTGSPSLTESSTADEIATLLPNNAVGTFTLTYTFVDVDGCSNSHSTDLIINDKPDATIIGTYPSMCANAGPITLTGSPVPNPNPTTSEGIWSGMGVTDSDTEDEVAEFDPIGLSGTITLTYTYTDEAGCTDSAPLNISVTNLMTDAGGPYGPYCASDNTVYALNGTPSGGIWTGDGISGTNFNPNVAGAGTHILTYTVTGACTEVVTTTVEVTSPTVATGSYGPLCTDGAVITLLGSPVPGVSETGEWSITNPTSGTLPILTEEPTFTDAAATLDPTGAVGTFTLQYKFTDATGCENTSTTDIVIHDLPNVAASAPSSSICAQGGTMVVEGSPFPTAVGETGTWTGMGITDSDVTDREAIFDPSGLSGTITLTYTFLDITGCTNEATVDVSVVDTDLAIGTYADVCINEADVDLQGTVPNVGILVGQTGTWSGVGVTDGVSEDGTGTFEPSVAGYGTHTLTYEFYNGIGQGSCTTTETTTITVVEPEITGSYGPICVDGTDFTLIGTPATLGTWSGAGVTDNGNGTGTFDISAAGVGTHTVKYEINVNNCTDDITTNIVVYALPTVSAGTDRTICATGGNVTLTGIPTGGTWTSVIATFTTSGNTATFDPTGLTGSRTFTYTYTDGNGCEASDDATVNILNTQPFAGPDRNFCGNDAIVNLVGSEATGKWSGPGIDDGILNDGKATFNPALVTSGPATIVYEVTTSAGCVDRDEAIFTVDNPTVALSAYPATVCQSQAPFTLSATAPATGDFGVWTGGNFLQDNGNGTATFTPSVTSGNVTATYTYTTAGGCVEVYTANINVNEIATVSVPSNTASVCVGSSVNLTGLFSGGATGISWTTQSNGSISFPNANNTTGVIYTPAGIFAGATRTDIITLTPIAAGSNCAIQSVTITVTVTNGPTFTLGQDMALCGNPAVTLHATNISANTTLAWSGPNGFSATTANPVYTPASLNSLATRSDVITVTATGTSATCSSLTQQLTINLSSAPTITATQDEVTICEQSVAAIGGTLGGSATSIAWSLKDANSGVVTTQNASSGFYAHDGTVSGVSRDDVIYLTANSPNNVCPAAIDSVLVKIAKAPSIALASNLVLCGTDEMQIIPTTIGTGNQLTWTSTSGNFVNNTVTAPLYTPDALTGAATFRDDAIDVTVTDALNACPVITATTTLKVIETIRITEGVTASSCGGDTILLNNSYSGTINDFNSEIKGDGGTIIVHDSKIKYVPTAIANLTNRKDTVIIINSAIGGGECAAVADTMIIDVLQAPIAQLVNDTTICEGDVINLFVNSFGVQDTFSSSYSVTLSAYPSALPALNGVEVKDTIVFGTRLSAGGCPAAIDQVIVTISPKTNLNIALRDTTICEVNPVQLNSNLGTENQTIHTWRVLNNQGTLNSSTANSPIYTPNAGLTAASRIDTLVLVAYTVGNICNTGTDSLFVTVLQTGSFVGVPDTTVCASGNLGLAVATTGALAQFAWSSTNGTFADATVATTTYTPNPLATGTRIDTLVANLTFGANTCPVVMDTTFVTVLGQVTVNAGTDATICGGTHAIVGTLGQGATSATWTVVNSAGTFAAATSLSTTYTPSVNTTGADREDILILTTNDPDGTGSCVAGVDTVLITITAAPTVNLGADRTIFNGETIDVFAKGSSEISRGTWSSTNGIFVGTTIEKSTYQPNPLSNVASRVDQVIYEAEFTDQSCINAKDTILITVGAPPAITKTNNDAFCEALCLDELAGSIDPATGTLVVLANNIDPTDTCLVNSAYSFKFWQPNMSFAEPNTVMDLPNLPGQLTFDCADRGIQNVNVYVTDANLNTQLCPATIEVLDESLGCGERTVSGTITTYKGDPLQGVEIYVEEMSEVGGVVPTPVKTDENGYYELVLKTERAFRVVPRLEKHPLNGLTAFDNVIISRHILGIEYFTSPYQTVAADVNKNGLVTANDIVIIRKLVLAKSLSFENNTSWRFVEGVYTFPDIPTAATQDFPEDYIVDETMGNQINMDFTAVKIGDVNGTARTDDAGFASAEPRNGLDNVVFQTKDQILTKGEIYEVPFQLMGEENVKSYQFTLDFKGLELVKIQDGVVEEGHFNTALKERGMLTTCWSAAEPVTTENNWFTLRFKANQNGLLSELLAITAEVTPIEAYTSDYENVGVSLEFESTNEVAATFDLFQNQPNPFRDGTLIGFTLPAPTTAKLVVMDVQGRVVKTIQADYDKGYNEVQIDFENLAKGVFYYRLETAFGTKVQKMMHLE